MITFGYKTKSNSIIRIVAATIIAAIFFVVSKFQDPFEILVKIIAAFLVASGLVTLVYSFVRRKQEKDFALMLVNGIVDIVLGLIFLFAAKHIVAVVYYLVAAFVVVFSLYHILVLVSMRKVQKVSIVYYIVPAVAIIVSVVLCGFRTKNAAGYIAGAAILAYAVSELIALIKVRRAMGTVEAQTNIDVPAEEIVDVTAQKVEEAPKAEEK